MKDINNEINSLKSAIDEFVPYVALGDRTAINKQLPVFAKVLGQVLPDIIAVYENEKMSDYKDDQVYWGEQLERILGALECGDLFLAYDALVHEMKANLVELQNLVG